MEPLPTLAAALGQAPGAQPQLSPAASGTAGLFEREVEREVERHVEREVERQDARVERAAESRAAAIEGRRSDRSATFEHERPEPQLPSRDDSDSEPTQALVDPRTPTSQTFTSPASTGRGEASPAFASPGGDPGQPGMPTGEAATATPQVGLPVVGAPVAPGQSVPAAVSASAGAAAPVSASTPNQATATFLQAARGGHAAQGATQVAVPAGDTALVEHAAEVLRQIRLALNPSARRVVVELNPEELGRLTIKLAMHHGRVSAVIRAESPQTLELLERHLPELRAALAESGVDAGDIDLQLASDGRSREHSPPLRHRTPATPPSSASTSDEPARDDAGSNLLPRIPVDGSVDTYA